MRQETAITVLKTTIIKEKCHYNNPAAKLESVMQPQTQDR